MAATKGGIKQLHHGHRLRPGPRSENAFQSAFKAAGGNIVGSVRFPVANPDSRRSCSGPKDIGPESIFIFIPGGAQPAALGKAMAERGIDKKKTRILGSGETTAEAALKSMGDSALDINHSLAHDYMSRTSFNVAFVKEYNAVSGGRNPDFFDRRLRRHARHLRDAEEDQGNHRRRGDDRRGPRA